MKDFTDQDIERISILVEEKNETQAREEILNLHPADIAEIIQSLNKKEAEWLFDLIEDNELKGDVLMELDEEERGKLLEGMNSEEIADAVEELDTDDAVELIKELDEDEREEVISLIEDVEQAGDIVDLLQYDEETAGGMMGTEMIVVNENWSMPECLKEMRIQAEDMDEVYNIYVVDNDNRLRGVLPLKKMITHPSASKIKHVMEPEPHVVRPATPKDEGALDFEKYNLAAVAGVDSFGRLMGRITFDDVMDEVREQSERDYQLASGISSDVDAEDSVLAQTKARIPWLLIGVVGGIVSSLILGGFEAQLAQVTALALFIPLIMGTGGNVGVQASAIVVQGLANGSLDIKNAGSQIVKELLISLLNATIISVGVFAYNLFVMPDDFAVTISVAVSLFLVVIFASVFGTFVPLMLEKLKIDPALATGPFILITNDVVGLLIYVFISTWLLGVIPNI